MLCYKDKTWCIYKDCKDYGNCHRAVTEKVMEDATKWWGSPEFPIHVYKEPPVCFRLTEVC